MAPVGQESERVPQAQLFSAPWCMRPQLEETKTEGWWIIWGFIHSHVCQLLVMIGRRPKAISWNTYLASLFGLSFLITWCLGSKSKHKTGREKKRDGWVGERERERENTEPSLPCVTPNLRNQAALLLAHSNGQESQRSKREEIASPVSGSLLLSLCKKSMWDGVYIGGATFENTIRQPPNNWK